MSKKILVTGANGFIAMHIVDILIKQGHHVRGTIRNLNDSEKVESLKKLGPIELFQADLLDKEAWNKPCEGVDIVLHVASPLPTAPPSDENLVIRPAVEGTLNVFNAALAANVKRVVMTSSGLCISGYDYKPRTYSEKDWVDISDAKTPYQKSKILAERAAWNFVNDRKEKNQECFELAVVIPTFVLGPILSSSSGASVTRFLRVFDEKLDKIDEMHAATCDVRDVALAHLKAAFNDDVVGQRNMVVSGNNLFTIKNWVDILKEEFGPRGYRFPEVIVNEEKNKSLKHTFYDNSRMRNVLNIQPTDFKTTIIDMAYSLIQYGLVKKF
ncbi:unnamed protein product [Brachionus calyciflorus]|uniref:NAD-dependent epimerase/dehydratase domain-containing protein n=1 Tax=Brachionus calyciflorus TaxID=104777 RepID=A0A813QTR1_9BILA|nr:unnamed protein product [Brachionus calyciflorus]